MAEIQTTSPDMSSQAIEQTISGLKKRLQSGPIVGNEDVKRAIREDLLQLKKQSRQLHEEANASKESVAALRKASDAAHLALQSVHYEKKHLERELTQILSTDIYDTVDFATVESAPTTDRKVAMNDKLQRVKNEVALRQSELLMNINYGKGEELTTWNVRPSKRTRYNGS
jgi:hypothetical protein